MFRSISCRMRGVSEKKPTRSLHVVIAPAVIATATMAMIAGVTSAQSVYVGPQTAGTNQWSLSGNWSAGVPNAVDAIASIQYSTNTEIEIDGVFTIGELESFNPQSTTLPTKPISMDPAKGLTLATSTGQPKISTYGASANVFLYHSIFGNQGFIKRGDGKATFRFNGTPQVYTGDVRIEGGTFGINQDSSFGAATNNLFLGAIDGISSTATIVAEPGSNAGTITIPTTRTINLNGAGAQLATGGTNAAAVTLAVQANITDNGGNFGWTKSGAGPVVISGNNTYGGTTTVSAGSLIVTRAASLPGYNVAGRVVGTGSGSVVARMGGTGEWTTAEFNALAANASLGNDAGIGVDTTNATAPVEIAGLTAGQNFNLSKLGSGTLRLTGVNNWTGTAKLRLSGGTLEVGPGAAIPNGLNLIYLNNAGVPATLDLGGTSRTISNFTEAVAAPTIVTNGSLSLSADVQLDITGNNGLVVDLSGLTQFTQDRSNRGMRILPTSINNATNTTGTIIEMRLAQNNLFKVNNIQVGGASGTSQGFNHEGRLVLGTGENVFNITRVETAGDTSVFQLGGFNGTGRVSFPTGSTTGSIKLRALDGVAPLTFLRIGETSSGVRSGAGNMDLSLGTVDALVVDTVISRHIAASANSEQSTLSIGAGLFNTQRLIMGQKINGGANPPSPTFDEPTLNSTLNLSGGIMRAGTVLLGDALQGTNAGRPNPGPTRYNINFNLNGGELQAGAVGNLTGTYASAYNETDTQRNFNFGGGSLTHLAGQDLLVNGGADLDANPLTTGNLVTLRATPGGGGIKADAGRTVTLGQNTRVISIPPPPTVGQEPAPIYTLHKTGAGDLVINGSIDAGVRIAVDEGRLIVNNGAIPALLDVNATVLIEGAAVVDVLPRIVAGYNAGTWDGIGYTSSDAAASTSPKLGLGYDLSGTAVRIKLALVGDADLNNAVGFTDLVEVARNYNQPGTTWGGGDFDYNGQTDFLDLLALARNYGQALPSEFAAMNAEFAADWALAMSMVPEPATLGIITGLGLIGLRRRR